MDITHNMATPQEKAMNGHNKGGLMGRMKGLVQAKHFGESKQGRRKRKENEKKSGSELF